MRKWKFPKWSFVVAFAILSACGSSNDRDSPSVKMAPIFAALVSSSDAIVFHGPRANYSIVKTGTGYQVTDRIGGDGVKDVSPVAVLRFADTSVTFDTEGVPGQAYRLYKAAFGRAPDTAGLSYWITAMYNGATMAEVATQFVGSDEFIGRFGLNPSHLDIVNGYYQNVLGRQGEPGGIAFWMSALDANTISLADLLTQFSESAENKSGTLAEVQGGIAFVESSVTYTRGDDTLMSCDDRNNPSRIDGLPWLPGGAKENRCRQSVFGQGVEQGPDYISTENVAAFMDGNLLGLRAEWPYEGEIPVIYQPTDWIEHGSVGALGELWWGRTARDSHLFVGQESYVRLQKAISRLSPEEARQWVAWQTPRMLALLNKQPVPQQSGDEKWLLFPKRSMSYRQVGSTMATFEGGLGAAEGFTGLAPGRLENARLTLDTSSPTFTGELTFNITVDNHERTYSMPILLDPEPEYRMHAASAAGGSLVKCRNRPNPADNSEACDYDASTTTEHYDATGAFFGDRASLAALHIRLTVNVPDRSHYGSHATGVIVLKADP